MNTRRSLDNNHKKFVPAMWGSWTSQLKLNGGDFGILQLKKVTGCGDHHAWYGGPGSIPMKWLYVTLLPAPKNGRHFFEATHLRFLALALPGKLRWTECRTFEKCLWSCSAKGSRESILTKSPWKPTWQPWYYVAFVTHPWNSKWLKAFLSNVPIDVPASYFLTSIGVAMGSAGSSCSSNNYSGHPTRSREAPSKIVIPDSCLLSWLPGPVFSKNQRRDSLHSSACAFQC